MDREEKKARYKNIVSRLKKINSKIESLNSNMSALKITTEKSIVINNKILNELSIDAVIKNLNSVSTTINSSIQSLNRKI